MVAHLHDAGLELILDVVYNHTAEGNELGPTLHARHRQRHLLPPAARQPSPLHQRLGHRQHLDLSHPCVLQMVTDSLRYWATEMRVDGFRFDLATILGRHAHGFDERHGFLVACRQDPVLSKLADRRALGLRPGRLPGGRLPARLGGVERPLPRHRAGLLARRQRPDRRPRQPPHRLGRSVQPARPPTLRLGQLRHRHDGFTLRDVVSYDHKHNEANDEGNRDGSDNNYSWNHGVEGPTDDPDIRELRLRQMRNMMATLLLSQGTPMLVAGDEFSRTQQGNNNVYCQDNELGWIDWELDDEAAACWTSPGG